MNIHHLKSRLKQYYTAEGISVDNFRCPNVNDCLSIEKQQLSHGSEAHLGSQYGVPFRIAVVSLDRGTGSENIDDRTRSIESLPPEGRNLHMRGTAELLRAIIHPDEIGHAIWEHFAMTNSAKCCYAAEGMNSLRKEYFQNYAPYARQELEILAPDLVITQGGNAKICLSAYPSFPIEETQKYKFVSSYEKKNVTDIELSNAVSKFLRLVTINGKNIVHLHSIHPSAWQGGSWRKYQQVLQPLCHFARILVETHSFQRTTQ